MTILNLPTVLDIIGPNQWDANTKINFFEQSLQETNRNGIYNIINFCKNTDFYTAPSSCNYHSNYPGGLLDHSLLVYSLAMKYRDGLIVMKPELDTKIPSESLTLACLLHDICKTGFYTQVEKWKKDTSGTWISYIGYDVVDKFPIGHGEKSVIMLQKFGLELTPDEMLAIRYHMGHWMDLGGELKMAYNRAQNMCPLMTIIQSADITSSLLLETQSNSKI